MQVQDTWYRNLKTTAGSLGSPYEVERGFQGVEYQYNRLLPMARVLQIHDQKWIA
jgi:hypothetical protein